MLNDFVKIDYEKTEFTNFNAKNQTIDVHFRFDEPFRLGLNTAKSDYVVLELNQTYPWYSIIEKDKLVIPDGKSTLQKKARARIELTFDYENESLKFTVVYAEVFFYIFIIFAAIQMALLLYKNVGLLTFWVLIDYA